MPQERRMSGMDGARVRFMMFVQSSRSTPYFSSIRFLMRSAIFLILSICFLDMIGWMISFGSGT